MSEISHGQSQERVYIHNSSCLYVLEDCYILFCAFSTLACLVIEVLTLFLNLEWKFDVLLDIAGRVFFGWRVGGVGWLTLYFITSIRLLDQWFPIVFFVMLIYLSIGFINFFNQ